MLSLFPGASCKFRSTRPAPNRRGTIFITSVGVMVFLTLLGAGFMVRSLNESRTGSRSAWRQEAFYLAEAAVERASINLRTPDDTTDDVTAGTLVTGTYTIDAPEEIGTLQYKVVTHGTTQNEQRNIEAVFQLEPQSVFQFALFGDSSVAISGDAQTDSFDSDAGLYDDDPSSPTYNKSQNGDVGTNATTAGGVTVDGSIFIEGQVAVGPDVDAPESVVSGYDPAFITGDPKVVSQGSTFPMPDVEIPAGCTTTLPDIVNPGQTRTFSAGVSYCPSGDITINGGETWTAAGSTKIYVSGELLINGNATIGVENDPTQMLFLLTSTGGATLEGKITGSTFFYGAIYGPNATVSISGDAEIFGSIIADTVTLTGNAQIHYDEALQDLTDLVNQYEPALLSWREL